MKASQRHLFGVALSLLLVVLPVMLACSSPAPAAPTAAPAQQAAPAVPKPAAPAPQAAATPAAAAPAAAPGSFKGTLKVHELPSMTGAFAAVVAPLWKGVESYTRYINDNGGINGYKVELTWADTGYQVAKSLQLYQQFKEQKPPMLVIYSSADGEALKQMLEQDQIVAFNGGQSDPQVFPPGWVFLSGVTYVDSFVAYMENLSKTWKGPDKPKLGLIVYEIGYQLAHIEAAKAIGSKLGIEFVDSEVVAPSIVDSTPILTRFRDKGVNNIYIVGSAPAFAVVSKDLQKLGLKDKISLTDFWWADLDNNIKLAGEAAEGTQNITYWPAATDSNANVQKVVEYFKKINNGETPVMANLAGWMMHELIYEGYRIALNKVGTPDKLTGPVMKESMQSIKDFQGLLHPKVTIDASSRITLPKARIFQVQKGKPVATTDYLDVRILPRMADGKIDWAKYEAPK